MTTATVLAGTLGETATYSSRSWRLALGAGLDGRHLLEIRLTPRKRSCDEVCTYLVTARQTKGIWCLDVECVFGGSGGSYRTWPQMALCTCPAGQRHKECKHVAVGQALIEAGAFKVEEGDHDGHQD